jgi:hypothetical protein
MKKLGTLLFGLFMTTMLFGQSYDKVSGYLGNRLSIGAGITVSPSNEPQKVFAPDVHPKGQTSVNKMFHCRLQYILNSAGAIGFFAGSYNTSMVLNEYAGGNNIEWGPSRGYLKRDFRLTDIKGSPLIKDRYFGGYYKHYLSSKGALAPIGTYVRGALTIHKNDIDLSNLRMEVRSFAGFDDYNHIMYKFEQSQAASLYPEISLAMGKTIPVTSRVLFDVNMEAGFHGGLTKESEVVWYHPAPFIYDKLRERLARAHYLKFSFCFEYLLF